MNAGACGALERRRLRFWTVRGRLAQRPLGLKRNHHYDVFVSRVPRVPVESRQCASAVTAEQFAASVEEAGERDRCNAGRVLADHRVRIVRPSPASLENR